MTDESKRITATNDQKAEVKTEKGPFKPFNSFDEGAPSPVCDLTTGKCSN